MNAQLARAMIQRQYRGVTPPRTITAPLVDRRDHTTEADRLAQFERSAKCVGGKHPDPFQPLPDVFPRVPSNEDRTKAFRAYQPVQEANAMFAQRYAAEAAPGFDYDQDLRDGFALKYQEEA